MRNYPNNWTVGDMSHKLLVSFVEKLTFCVLSLGAHNYSRGRDIANATNTVNTGTAVHVFDTYDWEF